MIKAELRRCISIRHYYYYYSKSLMSTDYLVPSPLVGKAKYDCDDHVCQSVCLSVCLSVCVREHISGRKRPTLTKFLCMLPMSMALRFSFDGVAIRYVLPVL